MPRGLLCVLRLNPPKLPSPDTFVCHTARPTEECPSAESIWKASSGKHLENDLGLSITSAEATMARSGSWTREDSPCRIHSQRRVVSICHHMSSLGKAIEGRSARCLRDAVRSRPTRPGKMGSSHSGSVHGMVARDPAPVWPLVSLESVPRNPPNPKPS